MKALFKMCLIIIATSPVNLSMSYFFIKKQKKKTIDNLVALLSNSTIEELMRIPQMNVKKKPSQMTSLMNKDKVDIAVVNDKAYWVKNNSLYTSQLKEDGEIDIENAEIVDVFSLSNKEIGKLLKIIDSLD